MPDTLFPDKANKPGDAALAAALGEAYELWRKLKAALEEAHGGLTEEWKHYGAAGGWTLKLLRGKRNLFFLSPREGYFRLAFVFGDRAVAAIERSDLPAKMVEELRLARKYAEGRALRVEVRRPADLELVKELVAVKIAN